MKKYNLILLFIIFTSTLLAQPTITAEEKTYDFGTITTGDVVTHNFVVKNTGEQKLDIEKVKASCGCTAVTPDKNELEPGDSTSIKVSFNSHGRRGVQKKYVYVYSNDPNHQVIRLSFTTKVLHPDEIDAEKVEEE